MVLIGHFHLLAASDGLIIHISLLVLKASVSATEIEISGKVAWIQISASFICNNVMLL
jgi:hypothetical protein